MSEAFTHTQCPICGGDGGETISVGGMTITACCDSCEAGKRDKWAEEQEHKAKMERLAVWESVCDSNFRRFDPSHPSMNPAFGEAYKQFDPVYRQGLCLIGEPGIGKTHVALWCLKKCLDAGLSIAKVKHSEFAKMAATLAKGYGNTNGENKAHHIADTKIKLLHTAGAILIDDVCKGRKTPTSEEAFYNMLDYRVNHRKITIWTANGGDRWLVKHFDEEYGESIVRRLSTNTMVKTSRKV